MRSLQDPATRADEEDGHDLRLPTELLIAIVDQVEADEDLLTLAVASRQFHVLALNRYFSRYDFDPYSWEIKIQPVHPGNGSVSVLGGLSIALDLMGRSIDLLSYDCGHVSVQDPEQMTRELKPLSKYISKLSSVEKVSVRLTINNVGSVKTRRDTALVFLNTVLGKGCNDIRIVASQYMAANNEPKDMPRYAKPSEWLKDYWPDHHHPPKTQHLKYCFIQSFPRFLRPFYFNTLSTNSNSMTDLAFKNIFGGGTDWGTMLSHLHFPHLHRLTIIYGVIPRDPFIKFLAKHPGTLAEFQYHHIRYEPLPKNPARRAALEPTFQTSLETLTTSPEHINNFLPSFASMLRLVDVIIKIEEHVSNFAALEGALRKLATCANKITLTLAITGEGLGFGAWFMKMIAPGGGSFFPAARPESKLRCVQTLVMDNGDWGFTDDNIVTTCLPRWVAVFPELRALTLRGRHQTYRHLVPNFDFAPIDNEASKGRDLVMALKEACPGLYVEYVARDSADRPLSLV